MLHVHQGRQASLVHVPSLGDSDRHSLHHLALGQVEGLACMVSHTLALKDPSHFTSSHMALNKASHLGTGKGGPTLYLKGGTLESLQTAQ